MSKKIGLTEFSSVINRYLYYSVLFVAFYYIFIFILTAILRMNYPFDLEWFEGVMLENAMLLSRGLSIYAEPSVEFISLIYPPGYFYASVYLAEITSYGYLPLRLISFLSTLSIISVIFLFVKKETQSSQLALVSAGLFAACFGISGFWFDLARVDMFFLALIAWAAYLMRFGKGFMALVLAGILSFLSLLTKQTAVTIFIPLAIYSIYSAKWKSLFYILPTILLTVGSYYYLNNQTSGLYNFWLFGIPSGHELLYSKILSFWTSDIMNPLGFAFLISLSYLIIKFFGKDKNIFIFYLLFASGFFICAWSSRIHLGGYDNVLIPSFIIIAIMFGLGINEFQKIFAGRSIGGQVYLKLFVLIAIMGQFLNLFYNPLRQIPSTNDIKYGYSLIANIKKFDGHVYIPSHPYYSMIAGKKTHAHKYLLNDFVESESPQSRFLYKDYINKLKTGYFSAIILDSYPIDDEIAKLYKLDKILFAENDYFKCKTGGHKSRPQFIMIPRIP